MKFIVSVDENWNIGSKGGLLQRIPEDMKQFRAKTINKIVVLGRKTLETFPKQRPLADRTNIILTRNIDFSIDDSIVCHSYSELKSVLKNYNTEDIMIIGGGEIYAKLIPYCTTGYVTKIHKAYDADISITNLDNDPNWEIIQKDGPYHFQEDVYYSYWTYTNKNVIPLMNLD